MVGHTNRWSVEDEFWRPFSLMFTSVPDLAVNLLIHLFNITDHKASFVETTTCKIFPCHQNTLQSVSTWNVYSGLKGWCEGVARHILDYSPPDFSLLTINPKPYSPSQSSSMSIHMLYDHLEAWGAHWTQLSEFQWVLKRNHYILAIYSPVMF